MTISEKPMKVIFRSAIFILLFIGIQSIGSIVLATTQDIQNPNNLPDPTPPMPQFFCGY